MDLLRRELAPIPDEAWQQIDDQARRVLQLTLAGRKLVDFKGPFGWKHDSVSTGRLQLFEDSPTPGVRAGMRVVQPLIELRTPIELDMMELDAAARGAEAIDVAAVVRAAEQLAHAEDDAIFNGYARAQIAGIIPTSSHAPLRVADASAWPRVLVEAKEVLRAAGIGGPLALALGPRAYDEVAAALEDGYPILKRLERIIEGPFIWAPAIEGAVLLSTRGGDFELVVGQDLSIGYAWHEKQRIELYLTESFTFRVLEPAAAIALGRMSPAPPRP